MAGAYTHLRFYRTQTDIVAAKMFEQVASAGFQQSVKDAVQLWAYDVIRDLQDDYAKTSYDPSVYQRTYKMFAGWHAPVTVSHGSLAVVFYNTARSPQGFPYMPQVQGDATDSRAGQTDENASAGWRTIRQHVNDDRDKFASSIQKRITGGLRRRGL